MPKRKNNGSKKKPKINISELLRKHRAGKSIGSTNRARLVARGLIAEKSGKYKGKRKDYGNRGKIIMAMHKENKRVMVDREDPKKIGMGGKMNRKADKFSNGLTPAQKKFPPVPSCYFEV